MSKYITPLAPAFGVLFIAGCSARTHIVGAGAQEQVTVEERQWYVLWGLLPINEVKSEDLAGDAEDYVVDTEITFMDAVINIFTGIVSVTSRPLPLPSSVL